MNDFVDEAIASCERLLGHRPDQAHIHRPDSKSVRLFLNDTTVIATRRKTPQRAELEVNVLKELRENGAPVPEILAYDGIWLMQEDVGRDRLSRKIYKTWESECERWLELALSSLSRIHSAAAVAGLHERVFKIGAKPDWLRQFINTPQRIGRFLDVPCPKLDHHRLLYTLNVPGRSFVKWDARPANAAARSDWTVSWYDWEHCGCRNRLDDVAWLITDESVPDWPVAEQRLLENHIKYFDEGNYPGGAVYLFAGVRQPPYVGAAIDSDQGHDAAWRVGLPTRARPRATATAHDNQYPEPRHSLGGGRAGYAAARRMVRDARRGTEGPAVVTTTTATRRLRSRNR